ncbi:MAG: DolP-mannose mannosyltransferase [Halobacteriales archaeon]
MAQFDSGLLERLSRAPDPRAWPRWALAVLAVAVPSQALAVWRVGGQLPPGTRPPTRDSIIFEYIGWYLTRGGRLYVDVWEIKPPLPYEITGLLAWLAGGDPLITHALNVLLTAGAAIGVALAAGLLVDDLTGAPTATFAAGMALYVVPAFHWRAAFGFKVKYFVAAGALLAIYLARQERPGLAGVLAGAAVGFWQLAIIVPALVLGVVARRTGRSGLKRAIAGTAGVVVMMLLPVLYWGALEAMLTETVLVPLLVGPGLGSGSPLEVIYRTLGVASLIAFFGLIGVVVATWHRPRETWWLAAGTAWFGLQVLLIDLDGGPDLFPLLAFLAVGIGLLLGFESGRQRPAALLLAVLAITSVVTMGGFGVGDGPLREPSALVYDDERALTVPYGPIERDLLFWRGVEPETCRVFFGRTQYQLVQRTDGTALQRECGQAGPVLEALGRSWLS